MGTEVATKKVTNAYWETVWTSFRKNKPALWSWRILKLLIFLAIFSNFIANEKPIYCKIDGKAYFPVLMDYGLKSYPQFFDTDWLAPNPAFEDSIMPLIPYSYSTRDKTSRNYVGPFDEQQVRRTRYRHWLGTDQLGRDIAAGMISGLRTALIIGVLAMSIAGFIGIILGSLAGYYGDNYLRISRFRFVLLLLGLTLGLFFGFFSRSYILSESEYFLGQILIGLCITVAVVLLFNFLGGLFERLSFFNKKTSVPVDMLTMRLIEIINAIPGLLLLLSIVALIKNKSIFNVMAVIGLISWTTIARFVRAELLRIRNLEYIEAARALGYSEMRIIFRHALPNALTPVLITLAFGIANAILLEAFLSFLGFGVDPSQVTWGSMLSEARGNFKAWWIMIFPGLAIFVTVTIFNLIGEGLSDALNPRLRR
ncbi:MAG: peptide ABC transporter permease [Saprospiraceae bacterium]|nr:MAG: peptide ABC transporter permease [Saprospiraceae bacterium]